MGLRSFYYKQEDKYFRVLNNLEKKGINFYKIVDPLEKKGIPTFLLFNIIILLLIILLVYMFIGHGPLTDESYSLKFVDSLNNPITNEHLSISFNETTKLLETNTIGISKVSGVEKRPVTISIDSDKYEIETPLEIDFGKQNNYTVFLKPKTNLLSKTIHFESNNELYTSTLNVSQINCSDNLNYVKKDLIVDTGILYLNDIPSNCGFLNVSIASQEVTALDSLKVDDTVDVGKVELFFETAGKGDVSFKLLDKDLKVPINNLSLAIVNKEGQIAREGTSNTNGVVTFYDVLVGNYNVLVYDLEDRYKPITELEDVSVIVSENVLETKEVLLDKAYIGQLKYRVIDLISKEAIPNVSVSIFKLNSLVKTLKTDLEGYVTFGVEENIPYKVTFNNENYIIRTEINQTISPSIRQVSLNPITSENLNSLLVSVEDDLSNPVDFAVVRLWDVEENIIIQTMTADIYGKVVIPNLDVDKIYKLDAIKGNFESDVTNPFRIVAQEENRQTIRMRIGQGSFNIYLKNEFGEPHQGSIEVYDASNDLLMQDKITTTNEDGFTIIRIRADKRVYFVIDNYDTKLITPQYSISANEVKELEFNLLRTQATSTIEFLGFYNNLGEAVNSVSPGQQVVARYAVHASKKYSRILTHIRTGDLPVPACSSTSHNVLEDHLFIRAVRYAKSDVLGSLTYTPCTGQSTDFSNQTLRNAKWFNLTINNPLEGIYLIEADIVVLDSALTNQYVNYRAEFYEGQTVFRSPIDTSFTAGATKQPLYAQTKQAILFIGSQSQCSTFLCYSFRITNKDTGTVRNIIDSYNSEINNNYRVNFNINILENKSFPNSHITITTGNSLFLQDYVINSVTGEILTGNNFESIDVSNLSSNDILSGEINFRAVDDLSDYLTITLYSQAEEVFRKNIYIDIKEAKEMNVEMVPRKLIPFVPNDVMISVTDKEGKELSNANVNVLLNDYTIEVGKTNQQGLFGFILPAPDLGDVLKIIVSKNEYRLYNKEIIIDDKLITPIPQEITFNLNSSLNIRESYYLSLLNNTAAPLVIESVTTTSRNDFVDLSFNLEENFIDGIEQVDLEIVTTLTEKGINLYTQQNFNTHIQVKARNVEMNKIWIINIPLNIRIVLGNALDSLDCLRVVPIETELRTEPSKETTFDLVIENTCTINQTPVDLGVIKAMADWEGATQTGVFSIILNNREYMLENLKEINILSRLEKDSKSTIRIKFKAFDISSAISTPIIYFTSDKPNINGVDNLKAFVKPRVIINNYAECLEIPNQPIPVLACNWFSGFNMFNQYHGQGALGQFNRNLNPMLFNPGMMQGVMPGSPFGGANYAQSYNMNTTFNPANQFQYAPGYMTQQQGYNYPQQGMIGQTGYFGQQVSTTYPYNFPTAQYQNMYQSYDYYNFMDPHMMGGYGQMGFSPMMNCPQRPFFIRNNCSEAVDIKVDSTYGVIVNSEKEFTLNPSDSAQVLITGGQEMGTFNLPISAKPTTATSEVYSQVSNIPVSVTLPLSFMPSKCIQVSPQKLDFSNIFDPNYKIVKVMNVCFDQGYRMIEMNYLDLTALEFEGVSFLNIGEHRGRIQPIKVDYVTDLQTNKPIEVWEIALRRNPEIGETKFAREYLQKYGQHSIAAGIVSTFRRLLIDVDDQVNLKFVLQVGLQPPHMGSPLVYTNVGMELKDNFQWLILDNKDNWDYIKQFIGTEIDYDIFTEDELMFVDTSVKLGYKLVIQRDGKHIMFIEVPEAELRVNKFERIGEQDSMQRCFMGMVKDFDIGGIKTSSYIQDLGLFFLPDKNDLKFDPVKISIEFPRRHYFKLCFERPVDSIQNSLVKDNKLKIMDYFKDQFTLMAINENTQKAYKQGHVYIGVNAVMDARGIDDVDRTDDVDRPTVTPTTPDDFCYDPTLSKELGFTGEDNFTRYGFDKILFEYDHTKINHTSCETYYCDQEQFYDYLKYKIDNNREQNTVTLGKVDFIIEGNVIKETENKILDLCLICEEFAPSGNEIDDYINEVERILGNIDESLRELTIIKIDELNLTGIENEIFIKGGKAYMTVNYFIDEFKFSDLNTSQKLEFYKNMEVYVGDSTNRFISNLKKFSNITEDYNNEILQNYENVRGPFNNYNYSFKENTNVSEPGKYIVDLEKKSNNVTILIGSKVSGISKEYKENNMFYYPINPEYLKYINALHAPFITEYKIKDYSSQDWQDIQKGYIFNLKDTATHYFIDSRPFYFNEIYSGKIVDSQKNEEVVSFKTDKLFLLNRSNKNVSLYSNPEIANEKNSSVFFFTNKIEGNFRIYNIIINNYKPEIVYNNMKDVFNEIKKENVCFTFDSNVLKLWHNPKKFR